MLIAFLCFLTIAFIGGYSLWAVRFWRCGFKKTGILSFALGLGLSGAAWWVFI